MNFGRILFAITSCFLTHGSWVSGADPVVSIQQSEPETAYFAGRPASVSFDFTSDLTGKATLAWSLNSFRATIARGELPVELQAGEAAKVGWKMDLPDVKAGTVVSATLHLRLQPQDQSPPFEFVDHRIELSICSPDAIALQMEWLKSLDLVLFDPTQQTADAFQRTGIPYRTADDPQCSGLSSGLIVYGEGIDPRQLNAVWKAAVEAATAGRRVIVLTSPGATVPTEGLITSSTDSIQSVALKKRDEAIGELDRRFVATAWPKSEHQVTSSLELVAHGDQPLVVFREETKGWQFLQVQYRTGGRLIWLGWDTVDSWDATPLPRYLLLKLLEDLTTDAPALKGKQNEHERDPS